MLNRIKLTHLLSLLLIAIILFGLIIKVAISDEFAQKQFSVLDNNVAKIRTLQNWQELIPYFLTENNYELKAAINQGLALDSEKMRPVLEDFWALRENSQLPIGNLELLKQPGIRLEVAAGLLILQSSTAMTTQQDSYKTYILEQTKSEDRLTRRSAVLKLYALADNNAINLLYMFSHDTDPWIAKGAILTLKSIVFNHRDVRCEAYTVLTKLENEKLSFADDSVTQQLDNALNTIQKNYLTEIDIACQNNTQD